jgi:hypothetical protein
MLRRPKATVVAPRRSTRCVEDEEVLCLCRNDTQEAFSLRVCASTPGGKSFLHGLDADLEPGGTVSFVSRVRDELAMSTSFAVFRLEVSKNLPRFRPDVGMRQEIRATGGLRQELRASVHPMMPPWILSCSIWSTAQQLVPPGPVSLPRALEDWPDTARLWACIQAQASEECTLLALERWPDDLLALAQEHGIWHFVLPWAVFFTTIEAHGKGSECTTCDGGKARITYLDERSVQVTLDAYNAWPTCLMRAAMSPFRSDALPWRLCYACALV